MREIIQKLYDEGHSVKEIAKLTKKTRTGVYYHLPKLQKTNKVIKKLEANRPLPLESLYSYLKRLKMSPASFIRYRDSVSWYKEAYQSNKPIDRFNGILKGTITSDEYLKTRKEEPNLTN